MSAHGACHTSCDRQASRPVAHQLATRAADLLADHRQSHGVPRQDRDLSRSPVARSPRRTDAGRRGADSTGRSTTTACSPTSLAPPPSPSPNSRTTNPNPRDHGSSLPNTTLPPGLALGDHPQSVAGVGERVWLDGMVGQRCGPPQLDQPCPQLCDGSRLLFKELLGRHGRARRCCPAIAGSPRRSVSRRRRSPGPAGDPAAPNDRRLSVIRSPPPDRPRYRPPGHRAPRAPLPASPG